MKYAVKVPFDGSMLYVVDADLPDLQRKIFDTYEDAVEHAEIFGEHAVVVKYKEEE